jgi:hypothetical protein
MIYSKKNIPILIAAFFLFLFLHPRTIKIIQTNISKQENVFLVNEKTVPDNRQVTYKKTNNGVLEYLEGTLFYYDRLGQQKWSTYIGSNNVMFNENSKNIYLADKIKNQMIQIDMRGTMIYSYILEQPPYNFKICEDNYVLIQHYSDNSLKSVTLLNDKGERESTIQLREGEIVNMTLSKKHNRIAVNTLRTNNSMLESRIIILDLKGNLIHSISLNEPMVLDLFYDVKGNLTIIQEKSIISINKKKEINWKVDTPRIQFLKVHPENYMVIYCGGEEKNKMIYGSRGEKIKILQHDGKWAGEAVLRKEIIGLDLTDKNILVYSPRTIYILNKKGGLMTEYNHNSDIKEAYFIAEENVIIVSKEKVSFIKLGKQ